jgi:WD40 repeat protein
LTLTKSVRLSGPVTDVAYSPNGKFVVTADANRKVTLFDADYEKANPREWGFHTAKVFQRILSYEEICYSHKVAQSAITQTSL